MELTLAFDSDPIISEFDVSARLEKRTFVKRLGCIGVAH